MPNRLRHAHARMGVLIALLLPISVAAQDLAIVGARVYPAPDAAPLDDATVVIRDGRIVAVGTRASVAVPAGLRVVDARGNSVTAGFWNSHIHLITPPFLSPDVQPAAALDEALRERFIRWGFTTLSSGLSVAVRKTLRAP